MFAPSVQKVVQVMIKMLSLYKNIRGNEFKVVFQMLCKLIEIIVCLFIILGKYFSVPLISHYVLQNLPVTRILDNLMEMKSNPVSITLHMERGGTNEILRLSCNMPWLVFSHDNEVKSSHDVSQE